MRIIIPVFPTLAVSQSALAEPPRGVAEIAPVHSLVARMMEGVGAPDLVRPPGATNPLFRTGAMFEAHDDHDTYDGHEVHDAQDDQGNHAHAERPEDPHI